MNAVAQDLIERGMRHMAACVYAVAKRLEIENDCELALVGGLFRGGDVVIQPMRAAVAERLGGCTVMRAELPPVLGAALLALERLDVASTPAIIEAIRGC